MRNFLLMSDIVRSKGEAEEIIENAAFYVSEYTPFEFRPSRIEFRSPYFDFGDSDFVTYGDGEYVDLADAVLIYGLPENNDQRLLESQMAHEGVHSEVRTRILGPLNQEIKNNLSRIQESKQNIRDKVSDSQHIEELENWSASDKLYSVFSEKPDKDDKETWLPRLEGQLFPLLPENNMACIDSAVDIMLLEDYIISLIDDFDSEYSTEMSESEVKKLSDDYRDKLYSKRSELNGETEEFLKPFKRRNEKAQLINHPAEEAAAKLLGHILPSCPREMAHIGDELGTESLDDLNLDNEDYIEVCIRIVNQNYDKEDSIYKDHEKDVADWMRELHHLYGKLRDTGLAEEESVSHVIEYAFEDVILPYSDRQIEELHI